ncbi:DUF6884 domain-containing protein [Natronococcus jeotgali]|uniref:DUF6884 domain-containing protein n=1 Tax=Natronococcus jeotgali TaxID=413812 RepID=UPI000A311592
MLSAKRYLLEPDGPPIEPYDAKLTCARVTTKQEWSETVFEQLQSAGLLETRTTLVFHAGRVYYEVLLPLLEETAVSVELPVDGLVIGERLRWYNEHI